jgi:hypothetical protein
MQTVPTLHVACFPGEFGKARDAPNIRGDSPHIGQELRRGDDLSQDRAGAQQLNDTLIKSSPNERRLRLQRHWQHVPRILVRIILFR